MKTFANLVAVMLFACVNSAPFKKNFDQVSLGDAVCQDGGNAACYVYCKAEGHGSGHCVGTEPNENCVCTNVDVWCDDNECAGLCERRGNCKGGYCVNGNECRCYGCNQTQVKTDACDPQFCSQACAANNCPFYECENGQCVCECDVDECNPNECMTSCHIQGYKQGLCGLSGDCQCAFHNNATLVIDVNVPCSLSDETFCKDICDSFDCNNGHCNIFGSKELCHCDNCYSELPCNPAECSMDCTKGGCAAGFCVPNSGCECVRCESDIFELNVVSRATTPAISCQTGGRAACIASCKLQGCETGYCEGTAPNEVCVCSRCHDKMLANLIE